MKQVLLVVCIVALCVFKTFAQCPFVVNAGHDTIICANQSAYLNGTVLPAGNYTYLWTPAGTLSSATIPNPVASPSDTTMYILAVTGGGCTAYDTVNVFVNGTALVVNATATPAIICPKQQVQLNASIVPTVCGLSPACSGTVTSPTVGSGTTAQPGNGTVAPTLFGNYLQSGRNQMLYTAAELTAALGGSCTLNGIAFNISSFNSNAYLLNFTISVTCTNLTSLSTFNNNLTQVLAPSSIQPTAGWNSFGLTNPYNWDGVSNLIVDVCWYDPSTFGNQNNKAQCTTTIFNSMLYAFSTTDLCGTNIAPTVSQLRPNVRFGFCQPNISNYAIVWTPSTGTNAVTSPGIPNPTATPSTSQNYTIAVGSGACIGYKTVNVQVDTSRVSAGADISSCPGSPVVLNATVVGNVIPGVPAFTWTTTPGGTVIGNTQSVTVTPNVNTTYVVAMTGGACTHYDTVNVTLGSLNVVATPTNVKCNGQNNGKIVVTASNGTLPYTYSWSANAATGNIDSALNLAPGSYQVTVTDINTCSGTATASITQPAALQNSSIVTTPIKCFGGSTGVITIGPTGGTTPYTYSWTNALPAVPNQTGLAANNYSVTTTDAHGCSVSSTIPMTQPTQITFNTATIQNEKCAGSVSGKITVFPTGGTGAFTYSWSSGGNGQTISNLAVNTYKVTVTDANQCTATVSYAITQPTAITFTAPVIDSTKCFGSSDGDATVNPAGGTIPYTYSWSPGNQTGQQATGLSAQQYSITVTDDSLCTATTTLTIPQPALIHITALVSNISCNGSNDGAIAISGATNAYSPITYSWSNALTTPAITGLSVNTYTVTITDAHACTSSASYNVTQPPALVLNAPTITNILCFGYSTGAIKANASGGTGAFTYSWSNNVTTQTITGVIAGAYNVTVTDARNCTVSALYNVTQPASGPVFGNPTITNLLCNGSSTGSITVSVSGGTPNYTYAWSQDQQLNSPTATGLGAGTYTVTATDAGGCSVSSSNTLSQPGAITFGVQTIVNDSCHGSSNGSAQITPLGGAGGPYTYTWNGIAGGNPQTSLVANTYIVIVTDANSCTASTTVVVNQPAPIQDSIVIENVRCKGGNDGSLVVYPYGGNLPFTYLWANGATTQRDSMLTAQAYAVTITDKTGCSSSDAANVTEPALALSFTHTVTQVKCFGDRNGTISVVAAGGTGPYGFSVTKDNSNFDYGTNGVAGGLDSGTYYIQVNDYNGCTLTDTAFVPSPVRDTFSISVDSTSCYGAAYTDGSIYVTPLIANNMPYTYTIDNGQVQDTNYFGNLAAGRHVIIATNQFGCKTTLDTTVYQPGLGYATVLPKDTTLMLGQSITLKSGFGPFPMSAITGYNWVTSEALNCVDCPDPLVTPYSHISEYVLTITYNEHCTASDSARIIVINNAKFFIPNSFTPNGDGNNDIFLIYGEDIKTVKLRVFNRWGEKVFESDSQFNGWDGTYKGMPQSPAVFTYDAQIIYLDDTKTEQHGSITLIR